MVVQSYFTDQIMINKNRMNAFKANLRKNRDGLRMDQYLEEMRGVDKIEAVYSSKVWA